MIYYYDIIPLPDYNCDMLSELILLCFRTDSYNVWHHYMSLCLGCFIECLQFGLLCETVLKPTQHNKKRHPLYMYSVQPDKYRLVFAVVESIVGYTFDFRTFGSFVCQVYSADNIHNKITIMCKLSHGAKWFICKYIIIYMRERER